MNGNISRAKAGCGSRARANRRRGSRVAVSSTLPAENPENLVRPWKQAAPRETAPPDQAGLRRHRRAELEGNHQGGRRSRAGGCATGRDRCAAAPQSTGSIPPLSKPKAQAGGAVIQAGSFKNKENADKARTTLAALGVGRGNADRCRRKRLLPRAGRPVFPCIYNQDGSRQGQGRRISGREDHLR